MKRKKILALTLAAAMSLALFSGCSRPSASSGGNDNPSANNTGSTSSEEPIVIKIGHTDSDTRSTHKWSVWLGEWLEEQAPGRFKVEVYPNGQLGDSPDMVAGVKLGTLTMEFDLSSVVSSVSGPATSAVDLPYLYPTYEDWVQGTFENGGLELFNETLAPSGYIETFSGCLRFDLADRAPLHQGHRQDQLLLGQLRLIDIADQQLHRFFPLR